MQKTKFFEVCYMFDSVPVAVASVSKSFSIFEILFVVILILLIIYLIKKIFK